MRAAQFHAQRDIRVNDVETPTPQKNEILISIEWCGICGTDLHEYVAGPLAVPTPERPHPMTKGFLPLTMGHEFCGRIAQVPSGSEMKVGQPVMVDPRLYCKSCTQCQSAATHACRTWGFLGLSGGGGGGFSETVAVDPSMCYPLPESVPLKYAALIEPLAVGYHAVNCAGVEDSDFGKHSVLVLGGGPVGIATIMVLRARGAGKIFVSEPTAKRKEQTVELADAVFNPLQEKVGEKCRELTGGEGVSIVFDCAGIQAGLNDGFDALRYGGVYVNVAGWEIPMVLPQRYFLTKEISVKGSFAYNDKDFKETVEAFTEGKFKGIEKMVTKRIILEDIAAKGFEELVTNKDEHIKILVTPKRENLS